MALDQNKEISLTQHQGKIAQHRPISAIDNPGPCPYFFRTTLTIGKRRLSWLGCDGRLSFLRRNLR